MPDDLFGALESPWARLAPAHQALALAFAHDHEMTFTATTTTPAGEVQRVRFPMTEAQRRGYAESHGRHQAERFAKALGRLPTRDRAAIAAHLQELGIDG
jgi:hypothetical protein